MRRSLALVGIMGSGKSTVGRLLAECLDVPFSDVDPEMERRTGLRVRDLWEQRGDVAFAEVEQAVLRDFLDQPPHVIALGGGTFVRSEIREMLEKHATSIWLRASSPTIIRRIEDDEARHPVTRINAALEMAGLAEHREGIYGNADFVIQNEGILPNQAVEAILALPLRSTWRAPQSRRPKR